MLERSEHQGYSYEVDAWACGVIMFTLLVGSPPFWHRKQLTMIRLIMDGRFSFASPEWEGITDETKDLIRQLLRVEPEDRITIQQALEHEVFRAVRGTLRRELSFKVDNAKVNKIHLVDEEEPLRKDEEVAVEPEVQILAKFDARRTLKVTLIAVQFLVRFRRLRFTPEPLSLSQCRVNPYAMRMCRKVIDNGAFRVYNHWVKKGEGQNRAALFEHFLKKDLVKNSESEEKKRQRKEKEENNLQVGKFY